ncbi:uncharacterized protein BDZ99DRAFT_504155 [Mytilinidion resinicola]|uniref:Uncharacterized protein n=1 Tax=Mytilinidion resinicola TaxID=574789 RepID=A0A6A6Y0I5_9PEZI|nr:uncharacterized protein BDZ99DRAFT_504155 [Mytilinidion resinicola]KAF2802160.1 hypothetical protein BDZ99DRAFT_504155 [Mytilinidion resinicola]
MPIKLMLARLVEADTHLKDQWKSREELGRLIWARDLSRGYVPTRDSIIRRLQEYDKMVEEEKPPDDAEAAALLERLMKRTDFDAKDNSKLWNMLLDRGYPPFENRRFNVILLHASTNTSFDYENATTGELTEMLKRRKIRTAPTASATLKIELLKQDDEADRDVRNNAYAEVLAWKNSYQTCQQQQQALAEGNYANLDPEYIPDLLRQRKLSTSGSLAGQIKRIKKHDKVHRNVPPLPRLNEKATALKILYEGALRDLEMATGQPVPENLEELVKDALMKGRTEARGSMQVGEAGYGYRKFSSATSSIQTSPRGHCEEERS